MNINSDNKQRPIIVGFGPAGMFAALELVDSGFKPLIFERGKKIEERTIDVQRFVKERRLDAQSNIQFGEGGAGSYSDGKLFSKQHNNSLHVKKVLDTYVRFGAPQKIRDARKPHLGTDVLCKIVGNMRDYILEKGGEINYSSKMTDLIISGSTALGVVINGNREYRSSHIYLAVGHSARDTFEMIFQKGVALEQKPVCVGLRIEHPAEIINRLKYENRDKGFNPEDAAIYSFTHTNRKTGRGAYTFCMCPGGEVINASSQDHMLVLNGMSCSARASAFSNSAIVVNCRTEDYGSDGPLAGIKFQEEIERKSFEAGGRRWKAPAQNLTDFLCGRVSASINENSYKMGTAPADMKDILPGFVYETLLEAFNKWKQEYPLFVSGAAVLLGPETRTSSPVKITRNERYESVNIKNLYPIGEGSGYSGGITSSAADALRAVDSRQQTVDRTRHGVRS
ncbi:MAG: hypothetical protein JW871_04305 [Endomicrobiales bacterium]|nr:hypothetical protein [Endomicrobiales bacterium]